MIIWANGHHSKLKLDSKYITLLGDSCHLTRMKLTNIKSGRCNGEYVAQYSGCIFYGGTRENCFDKFKVSMRLQKIGCCAFDRATWGTIMRYVKAANAAKKSK
jgi:hypothetical protein